MVSFKNVAYSTSSLNINDLKNKIKNACVKLQKEMLAAT
jgi:hypothetical protein